MKTPKISLKRILELEVGQFAKRVGLKIGKRVNLFLNHHGIITVHQLLHTSVVHEKNGTWRNLAGLRRALNDVIPENTVDKYRFLIIPI